MCMQSVDKDLLAKFVTASICREIGRPDESGQKAAVQSIEIDGCWWDGRGSKE